VIFGGNDNTLDRVAAMMIEAEVAQTFRRIVEESSYRFNVAASACRARQRPAELE
jgi:hypothetical protein